MPESFAIFLFFLSTLLALIEIEIEGKNGWATKTETFRKDLSQVRLIKQLSWSREITGYHIFLNLFLFTFFHMPYFFGFNFTLTNELILISYYLLFAVTWDFLWFVLNPYFGIAKFKKSEIPWFSNNKWVLGDRVSLLHVGHIFAGLVLAVFVTATGQNPVFLKYYLVGVVIFCGLTGATILISPYYHKLYFRLRK
jgi:hypothetical protein